MSIKRNLSIFLTLILLAPISMVTAAELRGKLTDIPGAVVSVTCSGGGSGSARIAASGKYAVRGLPAGQNCSFTVSEGGATSVGITFSTAQSVTIYSGSLSKYGNRIVVIRE